MAYIGKSPTGTGVRQRYYFTATGGETSLSGSDDNGLTLTFSDGKYVDVMLNGVTLVAGTDYNTSIATNTISNLAALSASDIVEIVVYDIFTVADTVSAKNGGTFSGNVAMNAGLTVDANGTTVATFDRATSDGSIVDLQKSGTTVGSIGTAFDDIYVGNGDVGLLFNASGDNIWPFNTGTQGVRDNAIDLGYNGGRFKDFYLSGGVYLGGTGSANYLDDYEEGTWTPTAVQGVTGFTISSAGYTKVGRLVTVNFYLNSFTGGDGNRLEIGGLPFTSKASTYYTAIFEVNDEQHAQGRIGTNAAKILFWDVGSDTRASYTGNTLTSHLIGSITYEAA